MSFMLWKVLDDTCGLSENIYGQLFGSAKYLTSLILVPLLQPMES